LRVEGLGGGLPKGRGPHGVEVGVVAGEPLALRQSTRMNCMQKLVALKGAWHEIFDFRFFYESVSPSPTEYLIGTISNLYENSWRYSKVKVSQREQF
jgi:hypothetical protein